MSSVNTNFSPGGFRAVSENKPSNQGNQGFTLNQKFNNSQGTAQPSASDPNDKPYIDPNHPNNIWASQPFTTVSSQAGANSSGSSLAQPFQPSNSTVANSGNNSTAGSSTGNGSAGPNGVPSIPPPTPPSTVSATPTQPGGSPATPANTTQGGNSPVNSGGNTNTTPVNTGGGNTNTVLGNNGGVTPNATTGNTGGGNTNTVPVNTGNNGFVSQIGPNPTNGTANPNSTSTGIAPTANTPDPMGTAGVTSPNSTGQGGMTPDPTTWPPLPFQPGPDPFANPQSTGTVNTTGTVDHTGQVPTGQINSNTSIYPHIGNNLTAPSTMILRSELETRIRRMTGGEMLDVAKLTQLGMSTIAAQNIIGNNFGAPIHVSQLLPPADQGVAPGMGEFVSNQAIDLHLLGLMGNDPRANIQQFMVNDALGIVEFTNLVNEAMRSIGQPVTQAEVNGLFTLFAGTGGFGTPFMSGTDALQRWPNVIGPDGSFSLMALGNMLVDQFATLPPMPQPFPMGPSVPPTFSVPPYDWHTNTAVGVQPFPFVFGAPAQAAFSPTMNFSQFNGMVTNAFMQEGMFPHPSVGLSLYNAIAPRDGLPNVSPFDMYSTFGTTMPSARQIISAAQTAGNFPLARSTQFPNLPVSPTVTSFNPPFLFPNPPWPQSHWPLA